MPHTFYTRSQRHFSNVQGCSYYSRAGDYLFTLPSWPLYHAHTFCALVRARNYTSSSHIQIFFPPQKLCAQQHEVPYFTACSCSNIEQTFQLFYYSRAIPEDYYTSENFVFHLCATDILEANFQGKQRIISYLIIFTSHFKYIIIFRLIPNRNWLCFIIFTQDFH